MPPLQFPSATLASLFLLMTLTAPLLLPASEDPFQPRNTQAPGEEPPTPLEAAAAIRVPDAFSVTLFAGEPDVRQPVAMALDERGRLWVAESYSYREWEKTGEDRVLVFEDTDNDGRHDKRTVFYTGANHLSGMTVGWGGVWICDSPNLLFIPDRNRDDIPDGPPKVVLDGWTTEAGHNFFNGLTWGIDGWLYGRHGITSPSTVGKPGAPDSDRIAFDCSIWRYHPVSKKFEIVCRGTTNPWGLDWNALGDMFFTNNVNGHLWHAIPGAFYPRMGNRADPFVQNVYDRIGMCADHLHHAGSTDDWTKTRDGKGVHGELGGGHSHCGAMIYLGGKWPEEYTGKIFMCNTHGRRVNVDRLESRGSGYVGRHDDDFLQANNPWFRGVELLYGPDGDVYLADWTDLGECHDRDGVHRTSGRIYKIVYGEPGPPLAEDLGTATDERLLDCQLHDNEWFARTARRLLQERAAAGTLEDETALRETLRRVYAVHPDLNTRIRLLLTLHATGILPPAALGDLANDPDAPVRALAIRIAMESPYSEDPADAGALIVTTDDPSPVVRLAWASQLGRNAITQGSWSVARGLATNPADADDPNIPLMVWFGIKDSVAADPDSAAALLATTAFPVLRHHIARRLAESGHLDTLFESLESVEAADARKQILTGAQEGLQGRRDIAAPAIWKTFRSNATGPELLPLVTRLDFVFDRDETLERMRLILPDAAAPTPARLLALELVTEARDRESIDVILGLLDDDALRSNAIRALGAYNAPAIAETLVARYGDLPPFDQPAAINTLSANMVFAGHLLDAIEANRIPRHAVTAYHARQIVSYKDNALKRRVADVWGSFQSSSAEKRDGIKQWQDQLTPDVLATADTANGHAVFQTLCMACHTLHGEGGAVGPELTGANRADVFYLLENIIDPGATLPQDYRLTIVTKKDGAVLSGNITSENEYALTLRTLADEQSVNLTDIAKRETLNQSLMPEGLLTPLSPAQVRDLIAFLQK